MNTKSCSSSARKRQGERVFKIACHGKSDVGLKRTNNEDSFAVEQNLGVAVLADGMGGAAAGELASRFFTRAALEVFSSADSNDDSNNPDPIERTFTLANRKILDHVKENPEHRGMGCTAELLAFKGPRYCLGHVGDSRTYLFRSGQLTQLTRDHSFVQDLLDKGVINSEEARVHRFRHVILRAVGTSESLSVDIMRGEVASGDLFLQCSDGLTDMVEDDLIVQILATGDPLGVKAEKLISAANAAGGYDNVTVVLSEVVPVV